MNILMKQEKIVLITGAAGGLGREFSLKLAHEGYHVLLVDFVDCQPLLQQIQDSGGKASAYQCDLSQADQVKHLLKQVLHDHGCCDILINNAAYIPLKQLADTELPEWQKNIFSERRCFFYFEPRFCSENDRKGMGKNRQFCFK